MYDVSSSCVAGIEFTTSTGANLKLIPSPNPWFPGSYLIGSPSLRLLRLRRHDTITTVGLYISFHVEPGRSPYNEIYHLRTWCTCSCRAALIGQSRAQGGPLAVVGIDLVSPILLSDSLIRVVACVSHDMGCWPEL